MSRRVVVTCGLLALVAGLACVAWAEDAVTAASAATAAEPGVSVAEGPVADTIVVSAEKVGADLIAMSTHGRTGIPRLILGSVANLVVHQSRVPVLLVRPEKSQGVHSPAPFPASINRQIRLISLSNWEICRSCPKIFKLFFVINLQEI